jgi:hypothetical protein
MPTKPTIQRHINRPAKAEATACCGNAATSSVAVGGSLVETTTCCGTAADAHASNSCCGSEAKKQAIASGVGCCG